MNISANTRAAATRPSRKLRYFASLAAGLLLVGAGVGGGLIFTRYASSDSSTTPTASAYSFYRSMMSRLETGQGSMMGGSSGWVMSRSGYTWMMGGAKAPGSMMVGSLPGFMMGTSIDPGRIMGTPFAGEPGPRVSSTVATKLGDRTPAGATVDRIDNRISFANKAVTRIMEFLQGRLPKFPTP